MGGRGKARQREKLAKDRARKRQHQRRGDDKDDRVHPGHHQRRTKPEDRHCGQRDAAPVGALIGKNAEDHRGRDRQHRGHQQHYRIGRVAQPENPDRQCRDIGRKRRRMGAKKHQQNGRQAQCRVAQDRAERGKHGACHAPVSRPVQAARVKRRGAWLRSRRRAQSPAPAAPQDAGSGLVWSGQCQSKKPAGARPRSFSASSSPSSAASSIGARPSAYSRSEPSGRRISPRSQTSPPSSSASPAIGVSHEPSRAARNARSAVSRWPVGG